MNETNTILAQSHADTLQSPTRQPGPHGNRPNTELEPVLQALSPPHYFELREKRHYSALHLYENFRHDASRFRSFDIERPHL